MVTEKTQLFSLFDPEKLYLRGQYGEQVSADSLLGKVICLLFGAGWSPPFLQFLTVFKRFYSELEQEDAPLQVIYVSFDRTSEEMRDLARNFPVGWLSLPHSSKLINYLKLRYGVVVIPRLIVVTDCGQLITNRGVKEVKRRTKRCFTDWYNAAK